MKGGGGYLILGLLCVGLYLLYRSFQNVGGSLTGYLSQGPLGIAGSVASTAVGEAANVGSYLANPTGVFSNVGSSLFGGNATSGASDSISSWLDDLTGSGDDVQDYLNSAGDTGASAGATQGVLPIVAGQVNPSTGNLFTPLFNPVYQLQSPDTSTNDTDSLFDVPGGFSSGYSTDDTDD